MRASRSSYASLVVWVAVAVLAVPRDARAYVDPNAAGLLYQILFPIFIAVTLAWRWIKDVTASIWHRIRRLMG